MTGYNELVERYFFKPEHVGVIAAKQGLYAHYSNKDKGLSTVLEFYLLANQEGMISQARFKAYGNPYLIAAAEWLCCQLEGSLIKEHPRFNYLNLVQALAIPKLKMAAALEIEDAYQALIKALEQTLAGERS